MGDLNGASAIRTKNVEDSLSTPTGIDVKVNA
jgi:hypothetical protein